MTVVLTYFKNNGTYYTTAQYDTKQQLVSDVFDEVRDFKRRGVLPGLVKGASFITHVEVPQHPHNFPALIL
jgi:hypothetical protein